MGTYVGCVCPAASGEEVKSGALMNIGAPRDVTMKSTLNLRPDDDEPVGGRGAGGPRGLDDPQFPCRAPHTEPHTRSMTILITLQSRAARARRLGCVLAGVAALSLVSIEPLVHASFFITPRESVDGRLTTAPVALVADQQLFSMTRGDFNVRAFGANYGPAGQVAYVVRGKFLSMRNRMLIMDPFGNKLGARRRAIAPCFFPVTARAGL